MPQLEDLGTFLEKEQSKSSKKETIEGDRGRHERDEKTRERRKRSRSRTPTGQAKTAGGDGAGKRKERGKVKAPPEVNIDLLNAMHRAFWEAPEEKRELQRFEAKMKRASESQKQRDGPPDRENQGAPLKEDSNAEPTFVELLRDSPHFTAPNWAMDELGDIQAKLVMGRSSTGGTRQSTDENNKIVVWGTYLPPKEWAPPGPTCPFGLTLEDSKQGRARRR